MSDKNLDSPKPTTREAFAPRATSRPGASERRGSSEAKTYISSVCPSCRSLLPVGFDSELCPVCLFLDDLDDDEDENPISVLDAIENPKTSIQVV